jgi:acetylornithine/succinyldiaminopimelate/putrescine aminotransferase
LDKNTEFERVRISLKDLLGSQYVQAVCNARSAVSGEDHRELMKKASRKVDLYPLRFQKRLHRLLPQVGNVVCQGLRSTAKGSSSRAINHATKTGMAPLAGYGYFRVGEDGRLYMTAKSEHYHTSLGHSFPGYELLETARSLGIPNATHNNTRGYITRKLEQELTRAAGRSPSYRVVNLETGSLAVEAALKMVLARFYKSQADDSVPPYEGKIPVVVVVGNDGNDLQANYHGTTMFTQTMRGMWGELRSKMERAEMFVVRPVRPNCQDDLRRVFREYDQGRYKIAAFFHEIVMMNYGAVLLTKDFLQLAYDLCRKSGAATVDDEIQSCVWHPDLFMFREWKLKPDFVAVGKGFPGGEYTASKVIFNAEFDNLPQFGALVTNGQEEIASLAYLVTMAWARANSKVTRRLGDIFEKKVRAIASNYKGTVQGVNGKRHMVGIAFQDVVPARSFCGYLNERGIDISVQTYKTAVPPVALLKLPLTTGLAAIEALVEKVDRALAASED